MKGEKDKRKNDQNKVTKGKEKRKNKHKGQKKKS